MDKPGPGAPKLWHLRDTRVGSRELHSKPAQESLDSGSPPAKSTHRGFVLGLTIATPAWACPASLPQAARRHRVRQALGSIEFGSRLRLASHPDSSSGSSSSDRVHQLASSSRSNDSPPPPPPRGRRLRDRTYVGSAATRSSSSPRRRRLRALALADRARPAR